MVASAGADRVVWGSDAAFLSMTQQIGRVLAADIPDPDKVKILSTNARGLLERVR
jgi:predicted TIM-barrel fold metal-dependent hydrolase